MAVDFEIIDNNELQFGVGASDELEFGTRDIIEIRQSGDYEDLTNKPSINGVTLIGDKTTEDLHIQAGVTSWNGQTGDVVYTPPEAPVQSVNGKTGTVVLDASDVGALPDSTVIPTKTSDLTNDSGYIMGITSSDVTSALGFTPYNATNPNGYVDSSGAAAASPVQSVNGATGTVVLDAEDVGALPDDTTYVGSVSVTPNLTSGTKVGSISVDGTSTDLYAPTNTDTKVTQTATTTTDYTYWRGLCVGNSAVQSESGAFSTVTDGVRTFNNIRVQPSTGTIKATTFKGNLTGDVTGTASGNLKTGDSVGNLVNDMGYVTLYDVLNASANSMILVVVDSSGTTSTCALVDAEQSPVSLTQLLNAQTKQGKVFVLEPLNSYNTIFRVYNFEYGNMSGNVVLSCEAEGYRYEAILADSGNGLVGTWTKTQIVVSSDIPTKTSDLTNDSGFVNSAQAASAAPVQSVNGQTGAVTVDAMPSATGEADGTALVAVNGEWTKQDGYGYTKAESTVIWSGTATTTQYTPQVVTPKCDIVEGKTYVAEYDGVEYTLVGENAQIEFDGPLVAKYIGNGLLIGLQTSSYPDCPFVFLTADDFDFNAIVSAASGEHSLEVSTDVATVHPINNKYIAPDLSSYMQKGIDYVTAGQRSDSTLGDNATAEGYLTEASGQCSHAEGWLTKASGNNSHAEGDQAEASGRTSHAEGSASKATAAYAHAEGNYTTASGEASHAEGKGAKATAQYSHAEGWRSEASGSGSHAEGYNTKASASDTHAEGNSSEASGSFSHAEGYGTKAHGRSQHAFGEYNVEDTTNQAVTDRGAYVEIVGNGLSSSSRSNARTLDWSGNEWVAGSMTAVGGFVGDVTGTASGNLPSNTTYAASPAVGGSATFANGIHYGRVDDTSTSTVFTATIPGITSYYDGLTVILYNGKVTSASGFTININGLGALGTYNNMALGNEHTPTAPTRDTTIFNVNYAMILTYCSDIGGQGVAGWICYRGYDANTNTIGYQIRTNSYSLPMTTKVYRYRLLFTSADGEHFVPANGSTSTNATSARTACQDPIDPFGSIVYYGTTAAVDVGSRPSVTNLWQEYVFNLGYSFQKSPNYSLTAWKPVYLKCSPQSDGSAIIYSTDPIVQDLPTTEDGFIYIFLGVAYSATNIELNLAHPVYYYKGGAVRLWTNEQSDMPSVTSADEGKVLMVVNGAWAAASLPVYNGGVS